MFELTDDESVVVAVKAALDSRGVGRAAQLSTMGALALNQALVNKVRWVWEIVCQAVAAPTFSAGFDKHSWLSAWADFYLRAATEWKEAQRDPAPNTADHAGRLIVGWHHRSWPRLARQCGRWGAIAIVARRSDWLNSVFHGNVVMMGDLDLRSRLEAACVNGQPIAAMLDYCYEHTRSAEWSPFLGRQCRTPSGIFGLVARYDYPVVVMAPEGTGWHVKCQFESGQTSRQRCVDRVNAELTQMISQDPSQWLLWPSLDRRWHSHHNSDDSPSRSAAGLQ
ncbi:LpxL/LpxP family acyltransferase [Mycobacterium kansasii]|uniref:Bacterial lipid A biosynthesis acyltransferase family protein n=3 Tax=Mycobacterium kansasii TaxID=1768 RepID=A0A1V3X3H3_MYCKA|nr:hypothetical protein [Mycobacterium kansasii]ETZ98453.1 bacterial lipid A biosynthesis acyltransferase family protein [Mycobacterium kansasii 824]AGZ54556.1 hypothetical protein MKAN_28740 [Mycobacterium kansasii ATCC 12478]ARG54576.1 hypothetical protein B1T43_00370 [Mycobacterium kansasii]ARG60023.1 hypothetical protein B1T45_00395 [Mycobacterium kansasii]ARG67767.1 hypothetical protein B1T47_00530 [Mycobacterium kansasii]